MVLSGNGAKYLSYSIGIPILSAMDPEKYTFSRRIIFLWKSNFPHENNNLSWELQNFMKISIVAEIAISAPPFLSGQTDADSRIWTGPGCVRGESMGRRSRGARRNFRHRFPLFPAHAVIVRGGPPAPASPPSPPTPMIHHLVK